MNFEDLQAAWKEQYPANAGAQAAPLDAKLLERIRRNQRRYAGTMALMVCGNMLAAGVTVGAILLEAQVGPHMPVRVMHEYEIGLGAGLALTLLLGIIVGHRAPGMYSIRADQAGSLADRVHRDARRYRFGQDWADGNQALAAVLQLALVIVLLSHFGLAGPWRYLALGLAVAPVLAVFARLGFQHALRPQPGQNLSEVLALSLRLTRSRARWMQHLWWQIGLGLAAMFLSMEPIWLKVHGVALFLLLLFVPLVVLARHGTRKTARQLLQPRLDELEALRAGLAEDDPPSGPA
jgi:hypothetical protein